MKVWLDGTLVAKVQADPAELGGGSIMHWDGMWRDYAQARGLELSPLQAPLAKPWVQGPLGAPYYGLPALLVDAMPEHFANHVFRAWRKDQGQGADLTPLDRLSYVGGSGMGAMEFERASTPALSAGIVSGSVLDRLDELGQLGHDVIQRSSVVGGSVNPDHKNLLATLMRLGASVGGAQPKILLSKTPLGWAATGASTSSGAVVSSGTVPVPGSDTDSSVPFIVKLAASTSSPWGMEKTRVEYAYYQMAVEAGLDMMPCTLMGDSAHFATQRFDRFIRPDGGSGKVHMQSLAAMVGWPGRQVYAYEDVFRLLHRLGAPHQDSVALFRHVAFQMCAAGFDDHVKNLAFLMRPSGQFRLAPSYDLTFPADPYHPILALHKMSLAGKQQGVTRADLERLARTVGIARSGPMLDAIESAVDHWPSRARALDLPRETIDTISSYHGFG